MFVLRAMGGPLPGYPITVVDDPLGEPDRSIRVDVAGQTCMWDHVAEDVRLPSVSAGSVLAILNQGAYAETMSTQMNGFPRAAVVLADAGRSVLVKRRETIEDIAGRNLMPDELWAAGCDSPEI